MYSFPRFLQFITKPGVATEMAGDFGAGYLGGLFFSCENYCCVFYPLEDTMAGEALALSSFIKSGAIGSHGEGMAMGWLV